MSARLYEPVDPDRPAQEQWPQRPPQPGDSQAQPIDLDTTSDEDDDAEEDSSELARDRKANDARLKNRFEAIFEKYGRDFTGVGDEIDLETGEIVVDNGHLENMQDEADAGDGDNEPLQFAHAFAENLKQEELSSSYESDADEDEDENESQDDEDSESETGDASEEVNDTIFSAREQSTESNTSPVEPDDESIDPGLAQMASAAHLFVPRPEGSGQRSSLNQSRLHALGGSQSGTTSHSGTPDLDFMRLPEVQETMLALKSQNNYGGRSMNDTAIAALGKSIASQIARFMKGPHAKGKQKKRKDVAWEYPELPEDKRRRLGTAPTPPRPRLESLKSAISPKKATASNKAAEGGRPKRKGKERPEPAASLWAPAAHPKIRRPRKKKQAEVPPASSLDDPEAVAAVDEIQDDQEPIQLKRCSNCDAIATVTWRKGPDGKEICNACGMYLYRYGLMKPPRPPTPPPPPPKPKPPAANTAKRVVQPPKEGSRNTKFTLEEDALVIKLKEFDNLNWEKIGRHFEGRSSFAVQCRYSKTLISNVKEEAVRAREALVEQGFDFVQLERDRNGGFLRKEDELLLQLCPVPPPDKETTAGTETEGPIVIDDDETIQDSNADQGPDFTAIAAEHFPGFSPQAIQDRYVYHLERNAAAKDPKAKKKPQSRLDVPSWKQASSRKPRTIGVFFSAEENERLVQYREVDPISWEAVGHKFPDRSGMSIQKRYTRELAQRKAIVAKGGKDPYSHLFKHGVLSAVDKDAGIQEARKQVLKVMEKCKFTKIEDERIVRLRQDQKLGWDKMAAQFPERTPDNLQLRYEYLQAKLVKPAGSGGSVEDPSIYDIPISDAPQRSEAQVITTDRDGENAPYAEDQPLKLKGPRKAKQTKFSKAEDKLILKLHFDQGLDWDQISTQLPGRTAEQIERRFTKKLLPDHGNYEPNDSSDLEDSDEEDLANHGDAEVGDVEALQDRQPEYLWEQHAGALPDAVFPGLEDLSDGELGPSSTFLTNSLKQHLQRSKAGPGRQQNFSKREEEKLIQLRREGLNWEAIMSELPGRTAYELASHWHKRLKPDRAAKGQGTPVAGSTHPAANAKSTDCFIGGSRAANVFTLLARGGTALLVADEVPITAAVAKAKKAQDKAFEAANAKRKGTRKKLSRRTKLLPSALPASKWLNQDGEETVVPSIEPGERLEKLRDGTLVQRFADPTPEVHGWDDSDDESDEEFFTASERSVSPAEYDETGFAVVDDSSVEVEPADDHSAQDRLETTIDDRPVEREEPHEDESEDDTDGADDWCPARRPCHPGGRSKLGKKSTSKKRKPNMQQSKRPPKRSRFVRDTETPESVVEIKDEWEDEQPVSEPEQNDSRELAQSPPGELYEHHDRHSEPLDEHAQPDFSAHTPEQPSPVALPIYDTPARYDQQSHPYYAAPAARMYSPIHEELPTEHDAATEPMDVDPALVGEASSDRLAASSEQAIAASSTKPLTSSDNAAESQAFEPDDTEAMDADSWSEPATHSNRRQLSEEPRSRTRRSTRRGGTSASPPPDLLSSATNPPPFSWNELVTMALKSIPSQRLSTNGIYLFLQDKFPYFKTCNAEWKKALTAFLARSSDFEQSAENRGEDSWTFASKAVKVPARRGYTPAKRKEATPEVPDTRPQGQSPPLFVEPDSMVMQAAEEMVPDSDASDHEATHARPLQPPTAVNRVAEDDQNILEVDEPASDGGGHITSITPKHAIKQAVSVPADDPEGMLEMPGMIHRSPISLMPESRRRGKPRKRPLQPKWTSREMDGTSETFDRPGLEAEDSIDPSLSTVYAIDPALQSLEGPDGSSSADTTPDVIAVHRPGSLEASDSTDGALSRSTYDKAFVKAHPEFKWIHRGNGWYRRATSGQPEARESDSAEANVYYESSTDEDAWVPASRRARSTRPTSAYVDGPNASGTYDKAYVDAHPEFDWVHRGHGRYRPKPLAYTEEASIASASPPPATTPDRASPSAAAPRRMQSHHNQVIVSDDEDEFKESARSEFAVPKNVPSRNYGAEVPILVRSSAFGRARRPDQRPAPSSDIFREPDSSSSDITRMSAARQPNWPLASATPQPSMRPPVASSPAPRTIFERLAGYSRKPTPAPQNAGSALLSRHMIKLQQRAASQTPVQYSRVNRAMTPGTGPSMRAVTPMARASSVALGSVAARRALAREGTPFSKRVVETPPPSRDADSEEDELA